MKVVSASFRYCSPVQVFDSYAQILHGEDDSIKNRNSIGVADIVLDVVAVPVAVVVAAAYSAKRPQNERLNFIFPT